MKKEKLGFEESMSRLSEIVDLMERGGLNLDEMIKLFEEGTKLAKDCEKMLDMAEGKVEKITSAPEEEQITTSLFDMIGEDQ